MKTIRIFALFILLVNIIKGQQQNLFCNILFESGSDRLSAYYKNRLDSLSEVILKAGGKGEIGISGYTDTDSDEAYNRSLSRRRAFAVKNYLVAKGIRNRVHLVWKGEEQQLNPNATEADKALNRRVEILYDLAKYNDVLNSFKKEYQCYTIDPWRDTLLTCEGGLKLYFGRGVLNTNSRAPVSIKVQEFYSRGDFVLAGLSTHGPHNTVLESGGMMNIEAWQSATKLEVRSGMQVGVVFRNRQANDSMQLFNGSSQGGDMSWLLAAGDLVDSKVTHHEHSKEMISMRYSIKDSSYVYSHYWEEGPLKITKRSIKGETSIDTVSDEAERQTLWMLGTTKLGWINCDRFYNSLAPKTNITVSYDKPVSPFVSMVFKDINSIMPGSMMQNDVAMFKEIPEGKEVTIIALFKPRNKDKVLFAMQQARTKSNLFVELKLEELSPEEVKERLKAL